MNVNKTAEMIEGNQQMPLQLKYILQCALCNLDDDLREDKWKNTNKVEGKYGTLLLHYLENLDLA